MTGHTTTIKRNKASDNTHPILDQRLWLVQKDGDILTQCCFGHREPSSGLILYISLSWSPSQYLSLLSWSQQFLISVMTWSGLVWSEQNVIFSHFSGCHESTNKPVTHSIGLLYIAMTNSVEAEPVSDSGEWLFARVWECCSVCAWLHLWEIVVLNAGHVCERESVCLLIVTERKGDWGKGGLLQCFRKKIVKQNLPFLTIFSLLWLLWYTDVK